MLHHEDNEITVAGYALIEQFTSSVFTVRLNENIAEDGEWLIDVVVKGNSVYGVGSHKFRDSILDCVKAYNEMEIA